MSKSLVIVESPAKAKTISKYLGSGFTVKSSVGHVRDLPVGGADNAKNNRAKALEEARAMKAKKLSPEEKEQYRKEKSKSALVNRMGVDPYHGWDAHYEILPGKEKVIKELKAAAKGADTIYLATDLDREGEAIAWHLREVIGGDSAKYRRVVFNEITKSAIAEAFQSPETLNINRVNAQQSRRFLDRVVGFMLSPLLWAKVARGLSAGRVQSVAVRLIVQREREIRAFTPKEYWELFVDSQTQQKARLRLQVQKYRGDAFDPVSRLDIDQAITAMEPCALEVVKREDKPTKSKPPAPFITSTLQQAASTRLGFSVKKTMMVAQQLYEQGFITYMRTDSTNLSKDAIEACRRYIHQKFGDRYVPSGPNFYASKEGAQEAHEAIRPTDVATLSGRVGTAKDLQQLYDLIWNRFVACQMVPAEYLSSQIAVHSGDFELRAKGRILQFDGFLKVAGGFSQDGGGKDEEDVILPDVKVGDRLNRLQFDPKQHFTRPAQRYTEASLVRELEKRGIGRPSTYAAIISTIQERGYVKVQSRRFFAEKIGEIVTDRLVENFGNLMEFNFTAEMEVQLDDVSHGNVSWKDMLDRFFADFTGKLSLAEKESGMRSNQPTQTHISCSGCARPMTIRTGATGVFLGCSGYALPPKERCKNTVNLIAGDEFVSANTSEDDLETNALRAKRRCPQCSTAMESYLMDEHRKLHICGNNPDCNGYELEEGLFKLKGTEGPTVECDKCHSTMSVKTGRFGKFFGCSNAACKNTRKILRNGEVAPPKSDPIPLPDVRCEKNDDFFLLRDGAAGLFLAASQFPKVRETRAPKIIELKKVQDRLDPKYQYLLSAPEKDPQGRLTLVRFSRKTKTQYVTSEEDGKATGWAAFYKEGQWQFENSASSAPKSSAPKSSAPRKKRG